jgi:Tol biopolymer transport system component
MSISFRVSRALARLAILGVALAGFGFSCDKTVNDNSVALLVTVRASLGAGNTQGGGDVPTVPERITALSGDGRYIAFTSRAPNLVPGDLNGDTDVFVRDMVARSTQLVSANRFGTGTGNGGSGFPSISRDGRYVAFSSSASNLHVEDGDTTVDVFVRDMQTGEMILASRASGPLGLKGNGASGFPSLSGDGRFVTFESTALNLDGLAVGGEDDDATSDIYRREIVDPSLQFPTILVSRQSVGNGGAKGNNTSDRPRISSDGRFVVFQSVASNLVLNLAEGGPDTNAQQDIFLRDIDTQSTRRVSIGAKVLNNAQALGQASDSPSVSDDGRFVAFRSLAGNLHPDDDGSQNDIFLFDTQESDIIICSQHTFGTQAGNSCSLPVITADGRYIVFESGATSLVNGDNNSRTDIFRHDRTTRETVRLSVGTYGSELNGVSVRPTVSADGQYVAFVTDATNAAEDDTNGAVDIYLRGPPR